MLKTAATTIFVGLVLCFNVVLIFDVVKGARVISEDEDFEIERQLKVLNKPAIKTFHTEWGDIVDCVDIYKQPSFDHPLLKDHKIELKPNFPFRKGTLRTTKHKSSMFTTSNVECPKGTVPIRRITKDELIKAKRLSKREGSSAFGESKANNVYPGESMVGLTLGVPGVTYDAASGNISIYNPVVGPDQFSSAEIAVENGSNDETNSIRLGWTVNPQLYHDNQTRFFIRWTADNFKSTGCYNNLCPGWIQTSQTIYPGMSFDQYSTYGGEQRVIFALVYQDPKSKNWWVVLQNTEAVGYWSNQFLTHLNSGATRIFWGGHVKAGADQSSPPMGSGHKPTHEGGILHERGSQFYELAYSNTTVYDLFAPQQSDIGVLKECPDNYEEIDYGFVEGEAYTFSYGGPGGKCT